MNILIIGANGLIGSHCVRALRYAGHRVIAGVHHDWPFAGDCIVIDYSRDIHVDTWIPRLSGIDVVINAVGIIDEHDNQTFEALHRLAPQALFAACTITGVQRVIQISALGADEAASTPFHLTKKAADDFLLDLPIEAVVLQPSLVFSENSRSTQLFAAFAAAPVLVIPAVQRVIQPVAIDDLVEAIVRLISAAAPAGRLAVVGGAPLTLRSYLELLRTRMGKSRTITIVIPLPLLRLLMRIPGAGRIANSDTLTMLERGSRADAAPFAQLLGRIPLTPHEFVTPARAAMLGRNAALQLGKPMLRLTIALTWIVTGIVSLGFYPINNSLELLEHTGLTALPAIYALFGAAGLDILLGVAALCIRRRWIWSIQILLILGYTLIISVKLPEFWLHPYGPVLKNLPLLAAIVLMRNLEQR